MRGAVRILRDNPHSMYYSNFITNRKLKAFE